MLMYDNITITYLAKSYPGAVCYKCNFSLEFYLNFLYTSFGATIKGVNFCLP